MTGSFYDNKLINLLRDLANHKNMELNMGLELAGLIEQYQVLLHRINKLTK